MNDKRIITDLLRKVDDKTTKATSVALSDSTLELPVDSDEALDLGDSLDFEGFQVVRREFFAHIREPSISFNDCKFAVNTSCISKFPETEYVQIMVNQTTKILAIRPCDEGARDSFPWCSTSKGKRKPKPITCKLFFAKIVSLMNWDPNYRYKLLGRMIHANGEYLLTFDLTATEIYQKTTSKEGKTKTSRTPVFPAEWQNQFGLPFSEHERSMQINIFDGYAIYSIIDKTAKKDAELNADLGANVSYESLTSPGGEITYG